MLDIKFIRENPNIVKEAARKRGLAPKIIDELLKIDEKRRSLMQKSETIRAEQKKTQDRERGGELKKEFKNLENELNLVEIEF